MKRYYYMILNKCYKDKIVLFLKEINFSIYKKYVIIKILLFV